MWTRVELKDYAKNFLKRNYWKAFLVCLIVLIFTGSHVRKNTEISRQNRYNKMYGLNYTIEDELNEDKIPVEINNLGMNFFLKTIGLNPLIYIGAGIYFTIAIIFIIIRNTIGYNLEVGRNKFFLRGFEEDVDGRYLLATFNKDEFWGIAKNMFLRNVYIALWSLLFVIPGIIKSYEYRMIPYILTKDPNISIAEAKKLSSEMTEGHKWDMFVLGLSFLGWQLLGLLFFGIGGIFVTPYEEATFARLYVVLSGNDDNDDNDDNDEYDEYDEIPLLD